MRVISKISLTPQAEQVVIMPADPVILSVGFDDMGLCMWAIVDTDEAAGTAPRMIAVVGEDGEMPASVEPAVLLGRVLSDEQQVLHVFDLGEGP